MILNLFPFISVHFDDHFSRTDDYHYDPLDFKQTFHSSNTVPEVPMESDLSIHPDPAHHDLDCEEQKDPNDDHQGTECKITKMKNVEIPDTMSVLPGGSGRNVQDKQLEWIAQQIEKTKIEEKNVDDEPPKSLKRARVTKTVGKKQKQ